MLNRFLSMLAVAVVTAGQPVRADTFVVTRHDAIATVGARFFDGSPAQFVSRATTGPAHSILSPGVSIITRPGTLGATISATALSRYTPMPDGLRIQAETRAAYNPSFLGADNPGGMALATLASVIEFELPAPGILWSYVLDIDDSDYFEGMSHVIVENLGRSEVLLDITEPISMAAHVLHGDIGDVIRVTTLMSAMGVVEPNTAVLGRLHEPFWVANFLIPEPTTFVLLVSGLMWIGRSASPARRRRAEFR